MTQNQILDLSQRWADAERRADAGALDALLASDFVGIGPLGFVLNRQQWLDRYRSGDLKIEGFSWDDVSVHDHGTAAVVVGVETQRAIFQGQPRPEASGRFRVTQVAVQEDGRWQIAGIQFSGPMPEMPPRQG